MPKRRERDPRRQFKDETGSLQRMGEALGWDREGKNAVKYANMPESGIHNEIIDAVEDVGDSKVRVRPKFPTKAELEKGKK